MDTGKGTFAEISKSMADEITDVYEKAGKPGKEPVFTIGETIQVKGSILKIRSFDKFTGIVTMKLQPRLQRE